ncbi:unnamed protein product [Blepharisma stoltei]|uniref:Uncharacterized protein n=1 Tax=Blepharisma stoltei TaxID=1481888 RepID=A0AAU9J828_9CILI|nr:unnamed protein product [Blepharisma stoltei]
MNKRSQSSHRQVKHVNITISQAPTTLQLIRLINPNDEATIDLGNMKSILEKVPASCREKVQSIFHQYIFDHRTFEVPTSQLVKLLGRNKANGSLSPKERDHAKSRIQHYFEISPTKVRLSSQLTTSESFKKLNQSVRMLSKERQFVKEVPLFVDEVISKSASINNNSEIRPHLAPGHYRRISAPIRPNLQLDVSYKELYQKKQNSSKKHQVSHKKLKLNPKSIETSVIHISSPLDVSIDEAPKSTASNFKGIYPNSDELIEIRKNFFRLYNSKNSNY